MPRRLIDRCQMDSIREFRLAARQRFDDALALAAAGRRTAAIYLWGYTAEMTLKAAYFSVIGMAEADTITWGGHLRPATQQGRTLGIAWPAPGEGHNVRAWAQLLIATRASSPLTTYTVPFGLEVQRRDQGFEHVWRETLRYRKNHAYSYEVKQVRESAEWLLIHSNRL
jgi:hypothetical protein